MYSAPTSPRCHGGSRKYIIAEVKCRVMLSHFLGHMRLRIITDWIILQFKKSGLAESANGIIACGRNAI
jgi:hypothetical protein